MNRIWAMLLLTPGCSVIAALFSAQDCKRESFLFQGCEPAEEGLIALRCEDGIITAHQCQFPESCIADFTLSKDSSLFTEEQYDGCSIPVGCGDGDVAPGEECDDGNLANTDSCIGCRDSFCGDGSINFEVENCEPPNTLICNDRCQLGCDEPQDCFAGLNPQELSCFASIDCVAGACVTEPVPDTTDECTDQVCVVGVGLQTFNVEGACAGSGVCFEGACRLGVCGNNIVESPEQCDDGCAQGDPATCDISDNGDGCDQDCRSESADCGDGVIESPEQCDDGNGVNFDGCSNSCFSASCDDTILQATEICEESNIPDALRGQTCQTLGFVGGELACDGCDNFDISGCIPAACGDGVVSGAEECDDSNFINTDACVLGCKIATCGDGFILSGTETCDDNNTTPGDGCDAACQFEAPINCGDGIVDGIEECDDGNNLPNDGCDPACQVQGDCSFETILAVEQPLFHNENTATSLLAADRNNQQLAFQECQSRLFGKELVFKLFVPPGANGITASLTSTTDMALLLKRGDCEAAFFACRDLQTGGGSENLATQTAGGESFFIFVDSKNNAQDGAFSLNINILP